MGRHSFAIQNNNYCLIITKRQQLKSAGSGHQLMHSVLEETNEHQAVVDESIILVPRELIVKSYYKLNGERTYDMEKKSSWSFLPWLKKHMAL